MAPVALAVPEATLRGQPAHQATPTTAAVRYQWNKNWTRAIDPITLSKGDPDNYFEVSSGKDLAAALTAVLSDVMSRNASAGAVATVSQQTGYRRHNP